MSKKEKHTLKRKLREPKASETVEPPPTPPPLPNITDAAWADYLDVLNFMEDTGAFDNSKPWTAKELGLTEDSKKKGKARGKAKRKVKARRRKG